MATYLFTIQRIWDDGRTLRIGEGVRMSELSIISKDKNFIQGIALELLFSNGNKRETFLLNYSISAMKQEEDMLLIENDPYIQFTLPRDINSEDIPIGTEVWWLDEKVGKDLEQMNELINSTQV